MKRLSRKMEITRIQAARTRAVFVHESQVFMAASCLQNFLLTGIRFTFGCVTTSFYEVNQRW